MRLILVALLLIGFTIVHAQEQPAPPPAPLIIHVNGSAIWASMPAGNYPYPITGAGYHDRPYLSPDGVHIAYKVISNIGVAALRVTGGLVGELPSEIEILNLTNNSVVRLTSQPEGASFSMSEPIRAIARSAPAWSPDGRAIAWTEDILPEGKRHLVIYTLETQQTTVIAEDLPIQAGFQQTLPVRWGKNGLAVKSSAGTEGEVGRSQITETITIYERDGTIRATIQPTLESGEFILDFPWIMVNGNEMLGIVYSSGRWDLVDAASGEISPLQEGTPELYSQTSPGGMSVVFGVTNLPDHGTVFTWQAADPDGTLTPLPYTGPLDWISISPAGNAVGFSKQGVAYVWQSGESTEIYGTNPYDLSAAEIIWGSTGWRIRPQ